MKLKNEGGDSGRDTFGSNGFVCTEDKEMEVGEVMLEVDVQKEGWEGDKKEEECRCLLGEMERQRGEDGVVVWKSDGACWGSDRRESVQMTRFGEWEVGDRNKGRKMRKIAEFNE